MKNMIRIGILKETKHPIDNRVALTPDQIIALQNQFPEAEFYVQHSDIRAYHDDEYAALGISVTDDLSNCDVLLGIKEAAINTLLPNKHYVFFGHIAKEQPYNQPLMRKMVELNITFSDYEYFVDDNNKRLCAFGWWAGVVGTYNSFRAYGLKYNIFSLPKPDLKFTLDKLLSHLSNVAKLCTCKVLVTGNGRVSQGAQYVLSHMGATRISPKDFISKPVQFNHLIYSVLTLEDLVVPADISEQFDRRDFQSHPEKYKSNFAIYSYNADMLLSCHFWSPGQPIYLDNSLIKDPSMRIRIIGDITCDINGSIVSTVRPSTHDIPFYDFCPDSMTEQEPFSSNNNITVMAVDTCPNALALDTSRYFGETLSEHVLPLIINADKSNPVIARATILQDGRLTEKYEYLKDYAGL